MAEFVLETDQDTAAELEQLEVEEPLHPQLAGLYVGDPWDPLPGESPRAYASFCIFRDLGPFRSIPEAAKRIHGDRFERKHVGQLQSLSSRYRWRWRASAWDAHQEFLRRREQQEQVRKMAERHANLALMLQQSVLQRLQMLDPLELRVRDVVAMLDLAVKIERQARGMPLETGDSDSGSLLDVVRADPQMALQLRKLADRLADLDTQDADVEN